MELLRRIEKAAREAGVAGWGVCAADPFPEVRSAIEVRVRRGLSAEMRFTYARPEVSTDVRVSFPWATRLVVAAWAYLPSAGDPGAPTAGTGRIARFATDDHYRGLRATLAVFSELLDGAGYRSEVLCDDNRLVDRAAAVRAGIGWWGKNTMVLAPRYGPWLLLGAVVTDAPLEISKPMRRDCGTCIACIPACPTGALVSPGVLDARRCLAHLAQAPGVIPAEYREAMGDRWYGCDDCLDACPPGQRLVEEARTPRGRIDLLEVLGSDDRSLLARFEHFYIPRRRARYLRRNALVAIGNVGGDGALGVVSGYLGHPDRILRLHAAWALGRLGGPVARAALTHRRAHEVDRGVVEEIGAALDGR